MKHNSNILFINYNVIYGLLICLLFTVNLSGQDSTQDKNQPAKDTINKLLDKTWQLKRTNPSMGFELLERIDSINTTLGLRYNEDKVWYYYGLLYRYTNKFDLSETYLNKYLEFHKRQGNKKGMAVANLARSYNFSNAGNYEESAKAIAASLKIYEELKDTTWVIVSMNKLGYLMAEIGNFEEAHRYLNKAISTAKLAEIPYEEQNAYNTKAVIFDKQDKLDSALLYYTKSYKIAKEVGDDNDFYTTTRNMSGIHRELGQLDSAAYYGQQALDLAKTMDVPYISMDAKTLMIALRTAKGNTTKAIEIIESITEDELNTLGLSDKADNYYHSAKAYKVSGNYPKALESFEDYVMYKDSLTANDSRNKINELEIAYQTEKKEKQIALLDLENQNAKLQISRKNRTIIIVSIALALITLLSGILYVIIRKYLKQQKVLAKALDEKSLLLKEIHHRVKNNLQLVSSLLTLQGQSITDDIALKAINEGKSRVRSMALIHQDLYQTDNITSVSAQTYFLKLCNELFDTYNIKKDQIKLITHIEPLYLDVDTLIPVGLIINELITNALKYAFTGTEKGIIEISLKEENNSLTLNVNDNGVGYDLNQLNSESFGNKLIRSLIQQLDGNLETKIDNGTKVSMSFKDYKISREGKN
jgi:two-component sensor histidine kinase